MARAYLEPVNPSPRVDRTSQALAAALEARSIARNAQRWAGIAGLWAVLESAMIIALILWK